MTHAKRQLPLERLKRRPEFLQVAATRIRHVTPGLILQMRKHNKKERASINLACLRLGFTVSKKVGNAVVRNRVKRRLKAVAEAVLPFHTKPNRDFVIIGRQCALRLPFADLLGDLEKALKKLSAHEGAA